jgi:hypothetical protein
MAVVREPREIHRRLGVSDALQHAAVPRAQRKDVAAVAQIARHAAGSTATRIVVARSCALIPSSPRNAATRRW